MGERQIVLNRAGHYFTPTSNAEEDLAGSCQSVSIAYVHNPNAELDGGEPIINVGGWDHNGQPISHTSVAVRAAGAGGASFHLNRDCPFGH